MKRRVKAKYDPDTFDDLQAFLTGEIVKTVYEAFDGAGLPKRKRQELTTRIAFNVCAAIDGSLVMKRRRKDVSPVLTFAADESTLIYGGGSSDMHEYLHGVADELFKR